jgi:hypothetical protein
LRRRTEVDSALYFGLRKAAPLHVTSRPFQSYTPNADAPLAWLSPWSPDAVWTGDHDCALEADVSRFIRSRPYVDALLDLELSHDPAPTTLEWYFLTSATRHDLREALDGGGCT